MRDRRALTTGSIVTLLMLATLTVSDSVADEHPAPVQPGHAEPFWQIVVAEPESGGRTKPVGHTTVAGRILTELQDGSVLLEERSGRIRQLSHGQIAERKLLDTTYSRMNSAELSADLLRLTGEGFHSVDTEHYVICSNAAPAYSQYCSRLLEHVYEQFHEFLSDSVELSPGVLSGPLPVVIFATRKEFEDFAARQHPEISFADTTGYYSVRDNQILLLDLTGDPGMKSVSAVRRKLAGMPRQVSTVVHEAVHQLTHNSGLQVRFADNPIWISEGLAVWFEPTSAGSSLLWNRPGQVNTVHQPTFASISRNDNLPISVNELVLSDKHFQDPEQLAAAYAESWGLMTYLIREDRPALKRLLTSISRRKPLIRVSAEDRVSEFREAVGKSTDEIQASMITLIRKLPVR